MIDSHARARQILVESLAGDASQADRDWLHAHLEACVSCSALRDGLRAGVGLLRLPEVRVDASQIQTIRHRLRERAQDLRHERELCTALVAASVVGILSGVLTAAGMARILDVFGTQAGVPAPLLAAAGVALWFLPASLAAAAALLARWRPITAVLEVLS
jgi:hypothetical protein